MARDNILHRELPINEKINRATRFREQIEIINKISPIKEYFYLAEVSYGYDAKDHVYYLDYPYPNIEQGKIIDIINAATRGELPNHSPLENKALYEDLDIEISDKFDAYGYVLYEFIPNNKTTPIITNIKTNIETIDEDMLRKYFFVIYHCTELDYNLEELFLEEPKLDKNVLTKEKKYLLYFNSKNLITLKDDESIPERITTAFISTDSIKELSDIYQYIDTDKIKSIYDIVIKQLRYVATHSRLYYEVQSALCKSEIERNQAEIERNQVILSYNVLHTLKNRVGIMRQEINGLYESYNHCPASDETRHKIGSSKNEGHHLEKLTELSYLAYFSSVHDKTEIYNEKFEKGLKFTTTDVFNFSDSIKTIFDIINYNNKNSDYKSVLNLASETCFLTIEPYFKLENNKDVRLFDGVYEAILFEIIHNFFVHSGDDNGVSTLSIKKKNHDLVFINKSESNDDLIDCDKITGGLAFIFNLLKNTESGAVYHKIINGYYEITLKLEGLVWQAIK
ncbi:MAG: hypothetical protein NTY50_10955 [Methylobacter sp.]|nr:hypothetical protein [Methylobacter sp.]